MGFVGSAIKSVVSPIAQGLTEQNNFQGQALKGTGNYTQQNFLDAIKAAQDQYNTNAQGQNALAQSLTAAANGQGPSLAANQLEQGTNANVAKTASIIGSQKGVSPALAAREAIMQGSNANQQAAGQAADLRANEQLNARRSLSDLYSTVGNQAVSQQGMLQGANAGQNAQLINQNLGLQGLNASAASQNAAATNATTQGIIGGASKAMMLAHGGPVPSFHDYLRKYADGGMVDSVSGGVSIPMPTPFPWMNPKNQGTSQAIGQSIGGGLKDLFSSSKPATPDAVPTADDWSQYTHNTSNVPSANDWAIAMKADGGQVIPGHAEVSGDSEKNDKVPILASPDEVVLPRSITLAANAPEKARDFMAELQGQKKKSKGYGSVLEAQRHFEEGMKHLNALKGAS